MACSRSRPPFRADHVGSLLRPEILKRGREQLLGEQISDQHLGPHNNSGLRAIEDRCICEIIAFQEGLGLKAVTDGEFRRRSWWLELILNWEGFAADRTGANEFMWRNEQGFQQPFSQLWLTGPIRWKPSAIVRAFTFLRDHTKALPKVTLPAPCMVHLFLSGDQAIKGKIYSDVELFWNDLVKAYRQELSALIAAGARYIQLDDTSITFLCDPAHREKMSSWGKTPELLLEEYAKRINEVIAEIPEDVTITMDLCRGNREGNWAAEGGYDPVADVLFNRIAVQGYFLEFDSARAGSFSPLRLLPKGKIAVLGLVSTKTARLESTDDLKRKIEEASHFADIEQLALSPQCGFASSYRGNPLSEQDEANKLARIVEVAEHVWGSN